MILTEQNREVELAVLGMAMSDAEIASKVAALDTNCFGWNESQRVHKAIVKIVSEGGIPDLIMLSTILPEDGALLIEAMAKGSIPSMMYPQYEDKLIDYKRRRAVETMAMKTIQSLQTGMDSVDDIMSECKAVLDGQVTKDENSTLADAMQGLYNQVTSDTKRCMTGISGLDGITGGFGEGQFVVIGARPGVGKSALATSIGINVARKSGPVLMVSLEMSKEEIAARLVAMDTDLSVDKITLGRLSEVEMQMMIRSMQEQSDIPFEIIGNARTPLQVRRKALEMQHGNGLKMIIIDYIQLMRPDGKAKSKYEEITSITGDLKALAMELKIPIIGLTQFNRSSEEGGQSRMPTMAEAKDSGSIEQDANVFLILHNMDKEPSDFGGSDHRIWKACHDKGAEWQKLNVAKNRQGRVGMVNLCFDKPHMKYTTIIDTGTTSNLPWERR